MKATGIVRRIDDLGRVVIPKEIRRTLRIREGDPLEIFVDREGEVILKKYSPIGELDDFAQEFAESLYENVLHITLICDRDSYIAVAGTSKKDYKDKSIGKFIEDVMEMRRSTVEKNPMEVELIRDVPEKVQSYAIAPIIAGGDPIGAIVLISREEGRYITETEIKVAEMASSFLGKQMEQ